MLKVLWKGLPSEKLDGSTFESARICRRRTARPSRTRVASIRPCPSFNKGLAELMARFGGAHQLIESGIRILHEHLPQPQPDSGLVDAHLEEQTLFGQILAHAAGDRAGGDRQHAGR